MKEEYDFSRGMRGKFYHPDNPLNLPVYLDNEVRIYLQECARSKGIDIGQLVSEMLKQDIKLIEVVKP